MGTLRNHLETICKNSEHFSETQKTIERMASTLKRTTNICFVSKGLHCTKQKTKLNALANLDHVPPPTLAIVAKTFLVFNFWYSTSLFITNLSVVLYCVFAEFKKNSTELLCFSQENRYPKVDRPGLTLSLQPAGQAT